MIGMYTSLVPTLGIPALFNPGINHCSKAYNPGINHCSEAYNPGITHGMRPLTWE